MAPQTEIPVAANVLGTIGTVFWCVQLIPQIWTNWRTKKTDGLPALMMFLWGVCGVPFGSYAIIQNFNIPIQIQPQVFMGLCLISWVQILVYGNGWSVRKGAIVGFIMAALFAGIEAALILTLKPIYERGNDAPALVVGIAASILLAAGLVPPYFEIYKRRGRVVGINFVFLAMDWSGAFFSLMALVAQNTFDILGGVLYIICALMEIGIFLSHIIWMFRTRKLRKQAKEEGKTYDELAAEIFAVEGDAFPFAERPLHPFFTSMWWRNRWNGQAKRPETAATGDEEQAIPNEEALAMASTQAPALASAPTLEVDTVETKPKPTAGGITWSESAADRGSASAVDDVCRSCSDSVAPTQCDEADPDNDYDEKR